MLSQLIINGRYTTFRKITLINPIAGRTVAFTTPYGTAIRWGLPLLPLRYGPVLNAALTERPPIWQLVMKTIKRIVWDLKSSLFTGFGLRHFWKTRKAHVLKLKFTIPTLGPCTCYKGHPYYPYRMPLYWKSPLLSLRYVPVMKITLLHPTVPYSVPLLWNLHRWDK